MKYVAIDFETANSKRSSVCEIGIAVVENAQVIKSFSLLVKPQDNYFHSFNSYLHGIDARKVVNEPEFDVIWEQIKHYFINRKMIAHNAAFDFSVLRSVLDLYGIEHPELEYSCTYQISRKALDLFSYKLNSVCDYLNIDLEHHQAKSDAKACAEIAINLFSAHKLKTFNDLEEAFSLRIGKINKNGYSASSTKRKKR